MPASSGPERDGGHERESRTFIDNPRISYVPTHPFKFGAREPGWGTNVIGRYLLCPLFIALAPAVVPLRLLLAVLFMGFNGVFLWTLNHGTDQSAPLPPRRWRLVSRSCAICSRLALLGMGYHVRVHGQENLQAKPDFYAIKHVNMLDPLSGGAVVQGSGVSKASNMSNFFLAQPVYATRGIVVRKNIKDTNPITATMARLAEKRARKQNQASTAEATEPVALEPASEPVTESTPEKANETGTSRDAEIPLSAPSTTVSATTSVANMFSPDDTEQSKCPSATEASSPANGHAHGATEVMMRRVDERRKGIAWPPIFIYPEGTTTCSAVTLRLRTSVFRAVCDKQASVQVVAVRYHGLRRMEYLQSSGLVHAAQLLLNPFGVIDVTIGPLIRGTMESESDGSEPMSSKDTTSSVTAEPQQTTIGSLNAKYKVVPEGEPLTARHAADLVGLEMARMTDSMYVPYTNEDAFYHYGMKKDARPTPEFARDFLGASV